MASSKELLRKAHAAAKGTTWLRELAPLPAGELEVDPLDELAVAAIARHQGRRLSAVKWTRITVDLVEGLSGTDPEPYERALVVLGGLLGASSYRPEGKGRADAVWIFGQNLWLTLEAKSDASAAGLVSMDNVRQANSQLRSLAADRDEEIPAASASIIVTPKQLVDPDAVAIAEDHLHLCGTSDMLFLAHDTIEAWRDIRASATNLEGVEAHSVIRQRFADRRLLPAALRERIADRPIVE
jgi:hypothetical protein